MNAQYAAALHTFAANAAAARHMNLDAGTYRASGREQGRGYGRSTGYAGARPYTAPAPRDSLFRVR